MRGTGGGGLLPCPQGQESLPIRAPVWTAGRPAVASRRAGPRKPPASAGSCWTAAPRPGAAGPEGVLASSVSLTVPAHSAISSAVPRR